MSHNLLLVVVDAALNVKRAASCSFLKVVAALLLPLMSLRMSP